MDKKKILFIITYLELGGAQKQLYCILKSLSRERYRLYLYSGNSGCLKDDFRGLPDIYIRNDSFLIRDINPFLDIFVFFRLFFFIRKHKFDIIHTHSPKASILGRWAAYFAGVKSIIYTVHGWPFHRFMHRGLYAFYLFLERLSARITSRIIVVSKADLKSGIEREIAPADKFVLIHYGVNIELFSGIYIKRQRQPAPPKPVVNISSLKPQKGLDSFLKMAKLRLAQKNGLKYLLVGGGPLKNKINRMIRDNGLEDCVYLAGWRGDITTLLTEASVLVLTSLWEGLPLAVLEAVVSGVPVVATDTGGVRDIVENYKNGIIVEPKDAKGLAIAVSELLDNYGRWSDKIEKYRKELDFSYWSRERMVRQIENIYELAQR